MPNIVGEYSLSEVAHDVGVSTAWINKVQKVVGALNKINQKGKRVSFSREDIVIFRRIKLLRVVDFPLADIKEIFAMEKKMLNFAGKGEPAAGERVRFIIHPHFIAKTTYEGITKELADKGYEPRPITEEWYAEDANKILAISYEVARRLQGLNGDIQDFVQKFDTNIKVERLEF